MAQSSTVSNLFPKDGIQLSHFHDFIGICGGRDKLLGLTTSQVCDQFVKERTKKLFCSYCDLMKSQQNRKVGIAQVF